ncbi:MAG TPA: alpha/beta fold hydrolase [Pseudolabrys sp.]|nr:alpha/beta fold hydrolase [Pseudolabrys sp.]
MISTSVDKIGPAPRIAVEHAGTGEFVIMLHGIGGNRINWTDQIHCLMPYFHVAAWDARGYGESDDYEGPLNFADYADDLARVLDHFRASRAHVIGLSMGGRIAMDFAARYSERLATLVLCNTHKGFATMPEERIRAFIASRKEPLLGGKEPKDIAETVARSLVGPKASESAFRRLVESMNRLHKESYIKSIEASVRMDPRSDLARIKVPTLVVVGADDKLTPPEVAAEIAAEIPAAKLAVIPDAGHLVNIEQPGPFNSIVLEFLRKHASIRGDSTRTMHCN